MDSLNYDFSKSGNRWVSYFDRLGFANFTETHNLITVCGETRSWVEAAKEEGQDFGNIELAWFSDTLIFYSTDDSLTSFTHVAAASRSFFDGHLLSPIPVRGALAFGELYADKANYVFLGKALVNAYSFGEKFDWLGFVLHPSALKRMEELHHPVSDLTYKRWDAPFKNPKHDPVEKEGAVAYEKESVVAYFPGPGSIMPLNGTNPYLQALEVMASSVSESHRWKYKNTIEFFKSFSASNSS